MSEESPSWKHPEHVAETGWLESQLDDPELRIFDCTTHLVPTEPGSDLPYLIESGVADYHKGHIPGAALMDLDGELSDHSTHLRMAALPPEALAGSFAKYGISASSRVVLYSAETMMWATRVWWLLQHTGFDNAMVLNGGLNKWNAEGRPLSTEAVEYPAGTLTASPRPELLVGREEVLTAIGDADIYTLNALSSAYHAGEGESRYGRPGRIPGSLNVAAGRMISREDRRFTSLETAAAQFEAAGLPASDSDKQIINYCGGGVSATINLFLQHQLGYENITLYDGSMGEWAPDESLPIETD